MDALLGVVPEYVLGEPHANAQDRLRDAVDTWVAGQRAAGLMRTRVQSQDSTFGFEPTESITLPRADALTTVPSSPGVPFFDDRARSYWDAANPCNSVKVPHTGTRIELLWNSTDKLESIIMVRPS
ncbi:hypothetical protein [Streptomyces zaomyceticus]|uniref:hypothetical protein n=1 Tax=Streptomyces zaomyceticus TaxID=68286 RepID=UPI003787C7AE